MHACNLENSSHSGLQPVAGYTFELQFHTPEGMEMKMGESHRLYEEVRSPKRKQSERLDLYLQLKGLWDSLPVSNSAAVRCERMPCCVFLATVSSPV